MSLVEIVEVTSQLLIITSDKESSVAQSTSSEKLNDVQVPWCQSP